LIAGNDDPLGQDGILERDKGKALTAEATAEANGSEESPIYGSAPIFDGNAGRDANPDAVETAMYRVAVEANAIDRCIRTAKPQRA